MTGLMETRVRLVWAALAAGVLSAGTAVVTAQTTVPPAVSATDRAAIEKIVRDYILAHPEIIPEAMAGMQNRQERQAVADNRTAIETPFPGTVVGNPKGDVSVVVFFDYACPYCRQGHADVQKLIAADRNIRVVYRDFPVISPYSEDAALVSLSAARQGRYERFHNIMFDTPGKVSPDRTREMANGVGLSAKAVAKDSADPQLKAELDKNISLGRSLGLTGTPSYIIGDKILSGAVGFDALKKAVDEARARAGTNRAA